MTDDIISEQKAAWLRVRTEAYETLSGVADVRVERRSYDDDPLTTWRAGMPEKPEPKPKPAPAPVSAALFNKQQQAAIGAALAEVRKQVRAEFVNAIARERAERTKADTTSSMLARTSLNRQRADHDERLSRQAARMEELQTKLAQLELRLDGLANETSKRQAIENAKVLDLPAFVRPRHG